MPIEGTALWKLLWEIKERIEVRHVDVHQNSFPGSKDDWNHQVALLLLSLEVTYLGP